MTDCSQCGTVLTEQELEPRIAFIYNYLTTAPKLSTVQ